MPSEAPQIDAGNVIRNLALMFAEQAIQLAQLKAVNQAPSTPPTITESE